MRNCFIELNHISLIYVKCANQRCMTLALVCCSITSIRKGKCMPGQGKFGKLGGRSHAV